MIANADKINSLPALPSPENQLRALRKARRAEEFRCGFWLFRRKSDRVLSCVALDQSHNSLQYRIRRAIEALRAQRECG